MSNLLSWYSSLICPLSPLTRSLIIGVVVVLAIVHIRLLYIVEGWMRRPELGLSRRFAVLVLFSAHIDAAIVGGYALLHTAAEQACPAGLPWVRMGLPLAGAGTMAAFAWLLFLPHIRSGRGAG